MAFKARVSIDGGKPSEVLSLNYGFHAQVDRNGKLSTSLKGGTASIVLKSKTECPLIPWVMNGNEEEKAVTLEIMDDKDPEKAMRKIEMKKTVIVSFNEQYEWEGGAENATQRATFSAEEMTVGDGTLSNKE